ncbi:hypothetical protein FEP76_05822 [Burkholderia multivorans]|nr:hypothetical protein [Burkholderia multivorans]
MLQLPVRAVRRADALGLVLAHQPEARDFAQQRDIARVADQFRVARRVQQHPVLDNELDVDHPAAVVLQIEQLGLVRVSGEHLRAHVDDFLREDVRVARRRQHLPADRLERRADLRVARAVARPRQRLVLPDPGGVGRIAFAQLIAAERVEVRHEQPGLAVRPQAQVDVEQRARAGGRRQPGDEAPRERGVHVGRAIVRIVVQEDQVEIGRVAELLAAELAVRDHREFRHVAVTLRELRPDDFDRDVEHRVGELRQPVADVLDRQLPGQVDQQDPEYLRVLRMPQQVHLLFGAVGGGQARAQRVLERRPVERACNRFVVEQFVEQLRVADQIAAAPARRAEHRQHAVERGRIFGQQRQVDAAPADRLEQVEQAHDRVVAARGVDFRRRLERALRDAVEALTALFRQPRIARRLPYGAQPREHRGRIGEAEPLQARRQRVVLAVVSECAAPDPGGRRVVARTARAAAHLVREDLVELRLDERAMRVEHRHQRRVVGKA